MNQEIHTLFPFYFILLLKPVFIEVLLLPTVTEVMGIGSDFLLSFHAAQYALISSVGGQLT